MKMDEFDFLKKKRSQAFDIIESLEEFSRGLSSIKKIKNLPIQVSGVEEKIRTIKKLAKSL